MNRTYKARNTQTGQIKEFKSRKRCNTFIDKKNNEYGAYLWGYVFGK